MKTILLKSPAKLNLYLRVINKRPDGYHNLKTIFERIDLCDVLVFSLNKTGRISIQCDHPHVPTGPKNLVYRVARLLQQRYGVHDGVDVKILKRIPVAAGLAGGSSNAATALIGLNRVWKLGLKRQELIAIGNTLGSDIAFFLHDCAWALGEGRGERIIPLKIKAKLWQILVVPKVKMYTPKVYNALDLKKLTKRKDDANILIHSLYKKNINKIHNVLSNDLEYGILLLAPKLEAVLKRMKALGIKGVSFSGSGSSVFGLTDSKQAAETLCVLLKKRYSQVFVVSTC